MDRTEVLKKHSNGELLEIPHSKYPTLARLFYEDGNGIQRRTGYLKCIQCSIILSGGGGSNGRHVLLSCPARPKKKPEKEPAAPDPSQKSMDDFLKKQIADSQEVAVRNSIFKYFARRGVPFAHAESAEFQDLISEVFNAASPVVDKKEVLAILPDRRRVKAEVLELSDSLLEACGYELLPQFQNGRANRVVDYGKIISDHLSIFVSYLNDEYKLNIIPVGFRHCEGPKTADEIAQLILSALEEIGISEVLAKKAMLIGDGAPNLLKCGTDHFSRYVRCHNHALHNLCQHITSPYPFVLQSLTEGNRKLIERAKSAVENCKRVAAYVRNNKTMRAALPRLPNRGVDTRWLSHYHVIKDVTEMRAAMRDHEESCSADFRTSLEKVAEDRRLLAALQTVWFPLLEPTEAYQSEENLSLYRVVPVFKALIAGYEKMANDPVSSLELKVIAGVAADVSRHLYTTTVRSVHYAATLFSPLHKELVLTHDEYTEALTFIEELLKLQGPRDQPPVKKARIGDDHLMHFNSDELTGYLALPPSDLKLEEFWKSHQAVFPRLAVVLKTIFSCLPSESVCERQFSRAAFVINKFRSSMDPSTVEQVVLAAQLTEKYPIE